MRALDFALSRILPESLRRDSYDMSKKGVADIMTSVAREHPDQYREVSKRIGDLGRKNAFLQGFTIGPDDTRPVIDTGTYYARMDAELASLREKKLPADDFDTARNDIMQRYSDLIEKDTMGAALKSDNSFARSVASGARGNPAHVKAILSTPGIYADAQGNIIPLFIRNSFASGMRPAETLAGTYGGRAAVISTKSATAKGGDLAKLLNQSTSHYNVTEKDCGVNNGLDFEPSDTSLRGRVLARDIAGLKAGSVIDKHALAVIRKQDKPVIARSPLTCKAAHGLCAHCAGLNSDGNFPRIGDSLGITAGQSLCLDGDTEVQMADGSSKKIRDVRAGDIVMGSDRRGVVRPVKVLDVFDNGKQPCRTYVVGNGRSSEYQISVTCTPQHKFLSVQKGRGKNIDMTPETYAIEPIATSVARRRAYAVHPQWYDDAGHLSVDEARLIGVILGDGCITGGVASGGLSLSCYDPPMVADLHDDLSRLGLHLQEMCPGEYRVAASCASAPYQITANGDFVRNTLKRILANTGLWGKAAGDKHLPESVWQWDNESVANLIAGLIATDGFVGKLQRGVGFTSNSKRMLAEVALLLRTRFGVRCGGVSSYTKKDNQGNNYAPTFTLQAGSKSSLNILRDHIAPRIPGRKRPMLLDCAAALAGVTRESATHFSLVSDSDAGIRQVFDIHVDHPDHLFLLSNGLIASNSEPIVQAGLNQKHNAGASKGKKEFSGFSVVSQFAQVPDEFKDKATVAENDGVVTAVREAPQGGHYVTVDNKQHFTLPGFDLMVKPGDAVEAGDQLSDGLINPADIVRLRGLGEGRRYYADRLERILQDSGQPPDRRNIELVARAAVDHVRVDDVDEDSDFLPDDLVREADYMQSYKPPVDTVATPLNKATGLYLQQPVLHYTIGTRITPKIAERMRKVGAGDVLASPTRPTFTPDMQRLRTASHSDRDWMSSLSTSYLGKQMTQSAERGDETDTESNYHYAPRLAAGVGFGEDIERTGKF